jgi:hypothetical protein
MKNMCVRDYTRTSFPRTGLGVIHHARNFLYNYISGIRNSDHTFFIITIFLSHNRNPALRYEIRRKNPQVTRVHLSM